ncbi:MAG: sugar ABC transporter ATP-binding protein [Actinomycetales bacterium]|nr:sugar ABC transporter ATP-binding protein [Actinomycetales bacterium]
METPPRIALRNITKSFGGIHALSDVSFDVRAGEVHGLCGENGAGKSTLMKVLAGAYRPDSGEIVVDGSTHSELTPALAQHLGITIIYQENLLVPAMDVLENMFVGHEPSRGGVFVDRRAMMAKLREELAFLEISLNPRMRVENLSVAAQQYVKILKALVLEPRLLILDEPTSMFNVEDAAKVLRMVRRIASRGISVIYISHFLDEVKQLADRVTVIRDGQVVATHDNADRAIDLDLVTRGMVGRPVEMFYTKDVHPIGDIVLRVRDLRVTAGSPPINFDLRAGEILGIAGMVGSGRTELVRTIGGADRAHSGTVTLNGKLVRLRSPRDAIAAGIAHITEDRQRLGLMLERSVLENTVVVGLHRVTRSWFTTLRPALAPVRSLIEKLRIKTSSPRQAVTYLSGGNQQKVVIAKWLLVGPQLLIMDEPTRGIDVNAKSELYKVMTELTQTGRSIIMVSSDMPELVSMSDRVLVMRRGAITAEFVADEITEETIITSALERTQQ